MNIKKNFAFSSIITVSNYIFPFITYPYVSRVLGVTNIGICNYVDSIINYFILISMMGIGIVGIREIARANQNEQAIKETFTKLALINGTTTFIALIILLVCIETIPNLYEYKDLLYIGVIKLIANFLLIDWLYKGLEDFKYITKVTIFTKVIYVILVFLLIKNKNDYNTYYIILITTTSINAILNCLYAKKFIIINKNIFKKLNILIKPFLILGLYTLLTSMYTSFNVAYLGLTCTPTEVGYYTTATKLYTIILAIFSAFTGVMLPRMSSLVSENKIEEFKHLINKSVNILIAVAFPTIIISTIFAPEIIEIISGNGYEGAITPTRIIMPLIFIIGYEQILIIQILMPLKKDKAIFINSIIGACIGIILNITLVENLQSIGSSIVWLLSEFCVLISAQYFANKYINIKFPIKKIITNIIIYIPAILLCLYFSHFKTTNSILILLIASIFILAYFLFIQIRIEKNEFIINTINTLRAKGKQ